MLNLDKFPSIFIANWKLNGNIDYIKDYYQKLLINSNNCVVICSPGIFLNILKNNNENLFSGAQDVSIHNEGAFTGEISAKMLAENNIKFCLVGHSERRQHFKESNKSVNIKCKNLIENNIIPVICVGETLEEKQKKLTSTVLNKQIIECVPDNANFQNTIIAYEPIWAIGSGLTPSLDEIEQVHKFIKNLDKKFNNFKVLYGGSVKATNSGDITNLQTVDGCLVGGASLKVDEFNSIIS